MCQHQSLNIRQISGNRAEQVGYYRFLNNQAVSVGELVSSLGQQCEQQVGGMHVLVINDSSEINLQAHAGRLKAGDVGRVGTHGAIGFYVHPTLVLNGATGFPLGISSVQLWHRPATQPDKRTRDYKQLPIERKESYKWIKAAEQSQPLLNSGGAKQVTYVGDSEADMYEAWHPIQSLGAHVLVRACQDRRLVGQKQTLYATLSQQACQGNYPLWLPGDERTQRRAREAWIAVRCCRVVLQRPPRLKSTDAPASVALYAVEAKEVQPPPGQTAIHWR